MSMFTHKKKWLVALLGSLSLLAQVAVAEETFPLRKDFPTVKTISTADLAAKYEQAVIVDVRQKMEYDVVHISKALHIPLGQADFIAVLSKQAAKSGAPVVFYCNGITCHKSYEAVVLADKSGFQNAYCYDAGIFEWTKKFPDKAFLLGKSPAQLSKLIAADELNQHKLTYAAFKSRAEGPNAVVVDMRDPQQRVKDPLKPESKEVNLKGIRAIPGDRLVELLKAGEFRGKDLLIYDAVGKQVQWLQYYLKELGYQEYAFLAKGVLSAVEAGEAK